jgi:hypoxanthine phosphoribosyltransferase
MGYMIPTESQQIPDAHEGLGITHWLHPLIEQEEMDSRIDEMARDAAERYKGQNVIFVRVKEGGDKFADAFEAAARRHDLDFESGSITVKSMEGKDSNGDPKITHDYHGPDMKDRKVVLLEDIIDTAITVEKLLEHLGPYGATVIRTIVLFMKEERRNEEAWNAIKDTIDDVGFDVFGFVVGFNIDWEECYRKMKGLWLVKFPPKDEDEKVIFEHPKMPIRRTSPFIA